MKRFGNTSDGVRAAQGLNDSTGSASEDLPSVRVGVRSEEDPASDGALAGERYQEPVVAIPSMGVGRDADTPKYDALRPEVPVRPEDEREPYVPQTIKMSGTEHDGVLFVRGLIGEAIERGASDLHLEPATTHYRIRFRIDGVLREYATRPLDEYRTVLNTVKVLADLDIATHRIPQDGHIELVQQEVDRKFRSASATEGDDTTEGATQMHFYDIRVSVFPSVNGEVIVMRILNRSNALRSVEELGMERMLIEQLRGLLLTSFGMILVTGPTGSGKTTTLYSILSELKSNEKNIVTLEDPIEFHLDWMRQCEIAEEKGFTFERAMSSVLRQDPDVLMVGEIRDPATAEYAVRSALVGRIVGSTIHANTAIGTIARLLELGIPRSIVAHAVNGIIAQRLVRIVCPRCKEEYRPNPLHLAHIGLSPESGTFYRGRGCPECALTGYKGRMGIFSVMVLDDALRALIFDQKPLIDIQQYAIDHGMRTLKMDAAIKVLAGVTTAEEAARAV